MALLFFYLFLALVVSFTCSILESVLLSTPPSFLVVASKKGKAWARRFSHYKTNIDKPLSAILSLNTVAHTIGAAGVGAQAIKVFGEASFGIVSVILTILILVITEIIPKTLGANNWRRLAPLTVHILQGMIIVALPLVWVSKILTRAISGKHRSHTTSREEISALAGIGASEGIFSKEESRIIQNILRLNEIRATEIMTPRVVIASADEDLSLKEFMEDKELMKFSRVPLFAGDEEQVTGYVFRPAVLEELARDHHQMKLKEIRRELLMLPETMYVYRIWEKLLEKREHMALIVDEYGGVGGLITLEDIFETMLGLEIVDETDPVTDMQELARERWKDRQAKYQWIENQKE